MNMLMCIRRQEVKVQEVTMQLLERVKVRELMLPDDELQYVEVKAIGVEEMMTRIKRLKEVQEEGERFFIAGEGEVEGDERWCGESNEMQERHFAQFSAFSGVNRAAAR